MNGEYISIETARITQELEKENKKLQERIDKAIEYILENEEPIKLGEHEHFAFYRFQLDDTEELLNILQGDNNV